MKKLIVFFLVVSIFPLFSQTSLLSEMSLKRSLHLATAIAATTGVVISTTLLPFTNDAGSSGRYELIKAPATFKLAALDMALLFIAITQYGKAFSSTDKSYGLRVEGFLPYDRPAEIPLKIDAEPAVRKYTLQERPNTSIVSSDIAEVEKTKSDSIIDSEQQLILLLQSLSAGVERAQTTFEEIDIDN